jgi:hypothetical protein
MSDEHSASCRPVLVMCFLVLAGAVAVAQDATTSNTLTPATPTFEMLWQYDTGG